MFSLAVSACSNRCRVEYAGVRVRNSGARCRLLCSVCKGMRKVYSRLLFVVVVPFRQREHGLGLVGKIILYCPLLMLPFALFRPDPTNVCVPPMQHGKVVGFGRIPLLSLTPCWSNSQQCPDFWELLLWIKLPFVYSKACFGYNNIAVDRIRLFFLAKSHLLVWKSCRLLLHTLLPRLLARYLIHAVLYLCSNSPISSKFVFINSFKLHSLIRFHFRSFARSVGQMANEGVSSSSSNAAQPVPTMNAAALTAASQNDPPPGTCNSCVHLNALIFSNSNSSREGKQLLSTIRICSQRSNNLSSDKHETRNFGGIATVRHQGAWKRVIWLGLWMPVGEWWVF